MQGDHGQQVNLLAGGCRQTSQPTNNRPDRSRPAPGWCSLYQALQSSRVRPGLKWKVCMLPGIKVELTEREPDGHPGRRGELLGGGQLACVAAAQYSTRAVEKSTHTKSWW